MSCFPGAIFWRTRALFEKSPLFLKLTMVCELSPSGKRVLAISRRYKNIGGVLGKFLSNITGEIKFIRGEKVVRLTWPYGKMPRFTTIGGKMRSLGGLTKKDLEDLNQFLDPTKKGLVTII